MEQLSKLKEEVSGQLTHIQKQIKDLGNSEVGSDCPNKFIYFQSPSLKTKKKLFDSDHTK